MKLNLKVIKASCVNGKVNKNVFKQTIECTSFQEAINVVKERYKINPSDWKSYIDDENNCAR